MALKSTPANALPLASAEYGYKYPLPSFDWYQRTRRKTRVVMVGDIPIGGDHPIVVQSMVTANTFDTEAVVAETLALVAAGCQLVRITTPTRRAAEHLRIIKTRLDAVGCHVPLVADIHFQPEAALAAAEHIQKVRINPGNFADRKRAHAEPYSDAEYQDELARIADIFAPLIQRCKARNVALRIGVNHGSLAERVMNRYGDTPRGMVESALEFVRICRAHDYHEIMLSMKASNPKVMIQANRLLAQTLAVEGFDYPLHLGVTEAGEGIDGRTKSAIGIGSLLADGIGDTIRVSLTEDAVNEIPVAQSLVHFYAVTPAKKVEPPRLPICPIDPFSFTRHRTQRVNAGALQLGAEMPVRVQVALAQPLPTDSETGDAINAELRELLVSEPAAEMIRVAVPAAAAISHAATLHATISASLVPNAALNLDLGENSTWLSMALAAADIVTVRVSGANATHAPDWIVAAQKVGTALQMQLDLDALPAERWCAVIGEIAHAAARVSFADYVFSVRTLHHPLVATRALLARLTEVGCAAPIGLCGRRTDDQDAAAFSLAAAATLGGLLCDGIGAVLELVGRDSAVANQALAYDILQASGARLTRADFIACPSCGRTLFDLQETTAKIKAATGHLKDVRIAIMGCIVNGPGEMADADFGYVGGAAGKINLYKGKECVARSIPEKDAVEHLTRLIQQARRWVDA